MKYILITLTALTLCWMNLNAQEDPYQWLEEVDGEKPLEFVNALSDATLAELSKSLYYQKAYDTYLEIANSEERIVGPNFTGDYSYNFWRDKDHKRGIWRRTPKSDYLKGDPQWEVLLDLDALSEKDGERWVWKGWRTLYPDYRKSLVVLSKGGGDANIVREFDLEKAEFVEGGFTLPESKGGVSFLDENTLIISRDFGEGSLTTSGYPRQVKLWKRGTPIEEAQLIFECEETDLSSSGYVMRDGETRYLMIRRGINFYASQTFLYRNGELIKLDLPEDANMNGIQNNQLLLQLNSDWIVNEMTFKQGSMVSLDFRELIKGNKRVYKVVEPDPLSSISGVSRTENRLLVNMLTDVTGQLYAYRFSDGEWKFDRIDAPKLGTVSVIETDEFSDEFFFQFTNFLNPGTIYKANAMDLTFEEFKSQPGFFDASNYKVEQFKATSSDGTKVPYFVISAKNTRLDGKNPTLISAYGGFQVSRRPFYSGTVGAIWLENGGVYVLANIRGGGEYGPKWHQAGLKEKRQNIFDDLYAVSEDLIERKITSPRHLGVSGGSNGGLLVGVAFTQRPDLYNAIVCAVPLLDMKRYNKLLAGASWMGEYGNPDIPEEWDYIRKYSPYHNLKPGMKYPKVYFYTSTRDDRVHPGHARKMAAKMKDMGYPFYYYENVEGGHAGSSTSEQGARSAGMQYAYLFEQLK